MNKEELTKIEYRDKRDGKLKELWYDETEFYIQRDINRIKEDGNTEFEILENPKNHNLII